MRGRCSSAPIRRGPLLESGGDGFSKVFRSEQRALCFGFAIQAGGDRTIQRRPGQPLRGVHRQRLVRLEAEIEGATARLVAEGRRELAALAPQALDEG